jgi:hypothetical protein
MSELEIMVDGAFEEYEIQLTGGCDGFEATVTLPADTDIVFDAEVLQIPLGVESDPVFLAWKSAMFTTGSRQTGSDAGIEGQISINDDYIYVCVTGGEAGVAVWKRSVLFQT